MKHLTEEQLTAAYFGDLDRDGRLHVDECEACRRELERLSGFLEDIRDYPVPQRNEAYGREVWARLAPELPSRQSRPSWFRWWTLGPALAALLVAAFLAGRVSRPPAGPTAIPLEARERVLRLSIGDHLERSQMVLSEVVNANPDSADLTDERARARDLLEQNRLLRQTASRKGDILYAALLDELERVLLDIANAPSGAAPGEVATLQNRIESEGLLFKVRITGANLSKTGQRL